MQWVCASSLHPLSTCPTDSSLFFAHSAPRRSNLHASLLSLYAFSLSQTMLTYCLLYPLLINIDILLWLSLYSSDVIAGKFWHIVWASVYYYYLASGYYNQDKPFRLLWCLECSAISFYKLDNSTILWTQVHIFKAVATEAVVGRSWLVECLLPLTWPSIATFCYVNSFSQRNNARNNAYGSWKNTEKTWNILLSHRNRRLNTHKQTVVRK